MTEREIVTEVAVQETELEQQESPTLAGAVCEQDVMWCNETFIRLPPSVALVGGGLTESNSRRCWLWCPSGCTASPILTSMAPEQPWVQDGRTRAVRDLSSGTSRDHCRRSGRQVPIRRGRIDADERSERSPVLALTLRRISVLDEVVADGWPSGRLVGSGSSNTSSAGTGIIHHHPARLIGIQGFHYTT